MSDSRYIDIYKDYHRRVKKLHGKDRTDFILDCSNILFLPGNSEEEKRYEYRKYVGLPCDKEWKELVESNTDYYKDKACKSPDVNIVSGYTQQHNFVMKTNYKRENYFRDNVIKLLDIGNLFVDTDILPLLRETFKKYRIDENTLTYTQCRSVLKKLKQPKYYKDIYSIIFYFRQQNIKTKQEILDEIYRIFDIIQTPYDNHRKKQKHFLSYKYTLYKILEILGHDEILDLFPKPILKNRDIIYDHDTCWRAICEDCNLEYIPTLSFYE